MLFEQGGQLLLDENGDILPVLPMAISHSEVVHGLHVQDVGSEDKRILIYLSRVICCIPNSSGKCKFSHDVGRVRRINRCDSGSSRVDWTLLPVTLHFSNMNW